MITHIIILLSFDEFPINTLTLNFCENARLHCKTMQNSTIRNFVKKTKTVVIKKDFRFFLFNIFFFVRFD